MQETHLLYSWVNYLVAVLKVYVTIEGPQGNEWVSFERIRYLIFQDIRDSYDWGQLLIRNFWNYHLWRIFC